MSDTCSTCIYVAVPAGNAEQSKEKQVEKIAERVIEKFKLKKMV